MPTFRPSKFILMLVAALFIARTTAAAEAPVKTVVAVFKLDSDLTETPGNGMNLFGKAPMSLRDLTGRISKAADDANVKAIVVLSEGGSFGIAQTEEIQQALNRCKSAGKSIFVHSDSFDMRDYVLFAGADRISVVPTADIWITGLHMESPYLRGLLDKLGVQPDFVHIGDYKSAGEIFMRTGPSPEAEKMTNWLVDGIFNNLVDMIAAGRKVDASKVRDWIDNGPYTAKQAKEKGLIDAVEQRQDFEGMLKSKYGESITFEKRYGEPKQPTIDFSSPFALFKILGDMMNDSAAKKPAGPSVAIVYVDGEISLGAGTDSLFGGAGAKSTDIRKALDEAAADDSIKAVVLRVDSPGGSAVASEIILDATKRVKAKKPFVVSMGDVAGSGGYYVACASDTIFADKSTITASIGVVGGKMVTTGLWDKIGVSFHETSRGKNAGIMSTARTWNDAERKRILDWMNEVYGVFKSHVMESRGDRLKKPLEEMAGGRVFTGQQALELGLVDKIGTLQDAIDHIASIAKLGESYEVRTVPQPKNFLEALMEETGGKTDPGHVMNAIRGNGTLVDLALPYLEGLDPKRVQSIKAALRTLDAINRDGVILTTPELQMMSR